MSNKAIDGMQIFRIGFVVIMMNCWVMCKAVQLFVVGKAKLKDYYPGTHHDNSLDLTFLLLPANFFGPIHLLRNLRRVCEKTSAKFCRVSQRLEAT